MTIHVVTPAGKVGHRTIVPYSTVDPNASLYTQEKKCPSCDEPMFKDHEGQACLSCGYWEEN